MALYVAFNPDSSEFKLAFILCIIATIALLIFVIAVCPSTSSAEKGLKEESNAPKSYVAPYLCKCLGNKSSLRVHIQNDWLLASWIITIGCFFICCNVFLHVGL